MKVLVLNSGSSSLKFKVFTKKDLRVLAKGIVEEIGTDSASYFVETKNSPSLTGHTPVRDHHEALQLMSLLLKKQNIVDDLNALFAIGHRVVHGGESFKDAVIIDHEVISTIKSLIPLAPLHNPSNLMGIKVALNHAPSVPQVAVFDTAFHQSMPYQSFLYAIPRNLYEQHGIRRYGFHGTSYSFVVRRAARFLHMEKSALSCICLHLGNGASACAVRNGKCIDTSMGLTPLEGLVMGTRCGDLDPAIIFHLSRVLDMPIDEIDALLNRKSGLLGLCGQRDMRTIEKMAANGDRHARVALDVFCYRIKKYIGAYIAVTGRPDCLIFTGGIGEHSSLVREKVCQGLDHLGIILDKKKNGGSSRELTGPVEIGGRESTIKIVVVPTDEELEIAKQTLKVLQMAEKGPA